MRIVILATEDQKIEIINGKNKASATNIIFIKSISEIESYKDFDALLLLTDPLPDFEPEVIAQKPVIINSVINTLESQKLPSNFSRINGWPGFLGRPVCEVAANDHYSAESVFKALEWDVSFVKDTPGLVTARVLSMIINEAYFALGENVSTKNEIDLAMKLGTNYPMGPFEWLDKIGIDSIYHLLKKLFETNKRYLIAPLLETAFQESALIRL